MSIRGFLALGFLVVGCGTSDPGGAFERNPDLPPPTTPAPKAASSKVDAGKSSTTPPPPPPVATDGGAVGGLNTTDPFKGTTFASNPLTSSARASHVGKSAPVAPGKADDCLSCHNGTTATTPKFGFAGTIFTDVAGTTPAKDFEVILVDTTGKLFKATTDADGNVWQTDTPAFTTSGYVGGRNAAASKLMGGPITNGSCNRGTCHGSAATGPIHVP